jgi:hypothetical protein
MYLGDLISEILSDLITKTWRKVQARIKLNFRYLMLVYMNEYRCNARNK